MKFENLNWKHIRVRAINKMPLLSLSLRPSATHIKPETTFILVYFFKSEKILSISHISFEFQNVRRKIELQKTRLRHRIGLETPSRGRFWSPFLKVRFQNNIWFCVCWWRFVVLIFEMKLQWLERYYVGAAADQRESTEGRSKEERRDDL